MIGTIANFLILHAWIVLPVVVVAALVLSAAARSGAAFVVRIVARLLLIAAVIALVYDGTRTLAGGSGVVLTSLADHWQALHPASYIGLKGGLAKLHPLAWDQGLHRVFLLPAWIVVGVFGLLLAWIGRKRAPLNVYVN